VVNASGFSTSYTKTQYSYKGFDYSRSESTIKGGVKLYKARGGSISSGRNDVVTVYNWDEVKDPILLKYR
jgi:hypothetical protein